MVTPVRPIAEQNKPVTTSVPVAPVVANSYMEKMSQINTTYSQRITDLTQSGFTKEKMDVLNGNQKNALPKINF
jgi:hypothetical protein